MKKAVLYCTCCGSLCPSLPPDALKSALEGRAAFTDACFIESPRLCRQEEAAAALHSARQAGAEGIVAAACSQTARGDEAARHLAGLPLEWLDIREGCAWIHSDHPQEALAKATDLICMGLAALDAHDANLGQLRETPATPEPEPASVLVVGAGPAGLAAAAVLGRMGIKTILAERRAAVGGLLPQLGVLFPHLSSGPELLQELNQDLKTGGIEPHLETTVSGLQALPRGYRATLRDKSKKEEEHTVSAVIFAVGAMPVLPRGYFRHGELAGVSSQMELEVALGKVERGENSPDTLPRRAVFVQCVAARDEANPYCSAVCCPTALKNALRLRALVPDGSVTIVHRNIVTPGIHMEALYRKATEAGVQLRNHDPSVPLEAVGEKNLEGLRLRDALDGQNVLLAADSLVCSTPLKPAPGAKDLAQGLGLRLDNMGFACGREPVLPLSPHLEGVYLCGSARWPATVDQSLQQGRAAAVKAAAYLRALQPEQDQTAHAAYVRQDACSRCGRCVAACPYQACSLPLDGTMQVAASRCRQCGSCAAVCPTGAARLPEAIFSAACGRIKEVLGGEAL